MKMTKSYPLFSTWCLALLVSSLVHSTALAELNVSNVRSAQREGTKKVDIRYDLSGVTSPVTVSLQISDDGGNTFTVAAESLSGHFGAGITAGNDKLIVWDAGVDYNDKYSDQIFFKVTASDANDDNGGQPVTLDGFYDCQQRRRG